MRFLEIRRHSLPKRDPARGRGSDLSAEGVALARRVGTSLPPFHAVFTSTVPRALETAIAMGFAVTGSLDVFGDVPTELLEELSPHERKTWENPFAAGSKGRDSDNATRQIGMRQLDAWLAVVQDLPENAAALIVSHGRVIEAGLVSTVSAQRFAAEPPLSHCEGVRLYFDGSTFSKADLLRLSDLR